VVEIKMETTNDNQRLYNERGKRFHDAVNLKVPDRVPIAPAAEFYLTRSQGLSNAEAMYDYEKTAEAWKRALNRYNWDMSPLHWSLRSGPIMEMLGLKTFKWPGYNLDSNSLYQFVEKEYMLADEYDELLKDPTGYTICKLLPRMAGIFEPFEHMPDPKFLGSGYTITEVIPMLASLGPFVEMMERLKETGQEAAKLFGIRTRLNDELKGMGYPILAEAVGLCAFDWISDNLRGLRGTMLDMYRQPDKLKAAIALFEPICAEIILLTASGADRKRVYLPLHRGADGFMSDKQFAEFYWPQLKRLLLTLVDAGLVPMPFFEGDYTPRLKYLAELPPGKILGHFDKVDRKLCKEMLGETMCFWGNVPSTLLCTGTPDQVRDDVKNLIDTFAENGGLIIDASTPGPPAESKLENVDAMTETVFEYGKN